jgi:DNA invertase Pin-like site-specific DNA recombinase
MAKEKRYAVRYARWSSGEQSRGDTLRRQDGEFLEFCRRHDLEPLPEFELPPDDGVSAFKGDNIRKGSLADFLMLAGAGKIPRGTVLVVENQDRLSRDKISVVLSLFQQLIAAGVHVGDCLSNHIVDSLDNPATLMLIIMGAVRAHEHSASLSRRMKSVWGDKKARAKDEVVTAAGPHWLRLSADRKRWELIPGQVATMTRIFELAASGKGCHAIVQDLVSRGIETPRGEAAWHPTTIGRLLRWRAVLGEYQPCSRRVEGKAFVRDGEPVKGYYPAIIGQRTFDRVASLIDSRTKGRTGRPPSRVNVFLGLIFDEHDEPYHTDHKAGYKESRILASRYAGGGKRISYEKTLEAFLLHVQEIDPRSFREEADDPTGPIVEELAAIDAKLATIGARVKAEKGGDIDYLLDIRRDLTRDRDRVRRLLEETEARRRNPTEAAVKALQEGTIADPEDYKARLRLAVQEIVLKVEDVTFHDKPWKIGQATVHFRGGYTRVFCYIYKNTRGYLGRPLMACRGLRFDGHDPGPYQGLIREQRRSVFVDAQLGNAVEEFMKLFWDRYGPEDFAEWERWARTNPEEAARLQAESDEETSAGWPD